MKYRKRLALLALTLAAALTACAPAAGDEAPLPNPAESQTSAPAEHPTVTPAETAHTLQGIVSDASANTLTVETEDGTVYLFSIAGAEIDAGADGLLLGSTVAVTYLGTLSPGSEVQTGAQVTQLTVVAPAPQPTPEPEPTAEELARDLLAGLSVEEKVGQLFIARYPGAAAAEKAAQYHLGGYILFGRDFKDKSREEVEAAILSCQRASSLPMLIGVDEEGGTVNRVSLNPALRAAPFLSPQTLYAAGGFDLIRSDTQEKCALLLGLGINVNFAPVCDVSTNPGDFMYDRAFGQDAQATARYVDTVVSAMEAGGLGSVLKHFPGYGNNSDTHTGIAHDPRPLEQFETSDFLPFSAGIAAGADAVLVSHNIVACMDPNAPASLSPEVHRILREELGFTGVIITDDLAMDGVRDFTGDEQAAVLAVLAGNDLLCCTNFETQYPAVLNAVRSGEIPQERLDQAVLRVLLWKMELGLL